MFIHFPVDTHGGWFPFFTLTPVLLGTFCTYISLCTCARVSLGTYWGVGCPSMGTHICPLQHSAKSFTWLYQFILPPTVHESLVALRQELADLLCEGPNRKALSLDELHTQSLSQLLNSATEHKISHGQFLSEWAWQCSNKPLFKDTEIWTSYHFHVSQNTILLLIFFPTI